MTQVTDEEFLAALDSNPWLFAAATQPVPKTPSQTSTQSQTQSIDQTLSPTALLAAQSRRKELISRIDHALSLWTPTLPQTSHEIKQKENLPPIQNSILSKPSLDLLRHNSDYLTQKKALLAFKSDPNNTNCLPKPSAEIFDPYQTAAIDAANAGLSFFLTGSAGTGKSFVLKKIIRELRLQGKNVAVTASTGCAAVGIQGCTIHSLASVGLGMDSIEKLTRKAETDSRIRERFQSLHALVIDEISMIDSFLFDKIEAVIRAARSPDPGLKERRGAARPQKRFRDGRLLKDGGRWRNVPFGGLQVIVCGDFFQLPPVSASDYKHQKSAEKYFAFDAKMWKTAITRSFVLRVVHRQADRTFVGLLNELRQGVVSDGTKRVLDACYISPGKNVEADEEGQIVHFTKLFAYRRQVSAENFMQLRKLTTRGVRYSARDFVDRAALGTLTVRMAEQMLENTNAPVSVEIRKGARVLCLKNLDAGMGIVNGTAGVVVGWSLSLDKLWELRRKKGDNQDMGMPSEYGLTAAEIVDLDSELIQNVLTTTGIRVEEDGSIVLSGRHLELISPVVRFDNGVTRHMGAETWDIYGVRGQEIGYRKQVPLLLGWALSIHKAQGMTLGEVETDVGRAFDYGQVYVAVSRATSVHGLRLRSFDARKVSIHEKVVDFYKSLEAAAAAQELTVTTEGKQETKKFCKKESLVQATF